MRGDIASPFEGRRNHRVSFLGQKNTPEIWDIEILPFEETAPVSVSPLPERPEMLVEIDTVHDGDPRERLGLYALIDVY
jgi:hypothetical protein